MSGPPSLRAAGHALVYWQQRQEVNAHNLANTETAGYRARRVFAEALQGGLPSIGTVVDPREGDLSRTGGSLDLALEGPGRFVVETPGGDKLVRSGAFSLDGDGQIVDEEGNPLMGTNGPLVLPPGPVTIDARGGVSVAGERVGRLRVVRGDAPGTEAAVAGPARSGPVGQASSGSAAYEELPEEVITVRQGYIEGSNVSALDSLIEMTTIQRSFQSVQNSVRAIDSVMETVANRLGRVE